MIPAAVVATLSIVYFGLLFAVAFYADRKREKGESIVSRPWIYSLSLGVSLTSWTFYGSVGRAATSGLDFLATYLGPTLMAFTWWFLLRKMVRISKEQNIVSIADFISSRYGKSARLGAVVTVFAVVGILPYIALQLKAVAHTFSLLCTPPSGAAPTVPGPLPFFSAFPDTAFVVALFLGLFSVLFGARHLDASERHEGLVAAIVLESLVKLIAFLAVGVFVTYGLFDGFTDIFARFAAEFPERMHLVRLDAEHVPYGTWFTLIVIGMTGVMFLPRHFHILVIENSKEEHIKDAMWRFPAYAFLITLFVIPIALGGLLLSGGSPEGADYFVLNLPLRAGHPWLAVLVFIGGFSAAAGMVMVESVALSTMILNHLLMPLILRLKIEATDISGLLIHLKRLGIVAVVFLGYLYYRIIGESYALVNIGLVSLVAATQFAPSLIGGLYWKRANRRGAMAGLVLGFVVWFYTLLIPSFVRSGWMESAILEKGPFGVGLLSPLELFGLGGFDIWSHALFWTLFFNIGAFLTLSLLSAQARNEVEQALKFVDVFKPPTELEQRKRLSRAPTVMEFVDLMAKFIGEKQAHAAIARYLGNREIDRRGSLSEYELPGLKRFTERTLAGSVGAAPARIIIEHYLASRGSRMEDVFDIFGSVTLSRAASREQLGVLYETARMVAERDDLQGLLDNILDLLVQQFRFDLCIIRILDKDCMALTVQSSKGISSEHLGGSERELTTDTYIGEAFLTNTLVVVNDTDFLDKPDSAQILLQEGIASFAHAPITVAGEPVGTLSAFSRAAKGIFTDEFNELFGIVAGQVGVAWRNARQTDRLIKAREQERELQIAKEIQLGLLPVEIPDIRNASVAGICVPAQQVGGDYFDFLRRSEDVLDLVIADVSGHNLSAALIMGWTRTFIQARARDIRGPGKVLNALNEFFYEDLTRAELFITMFYLSFDADTGTITYASAGHNPPLLWRAQSRTCERLDAEGLILGVRRNVAFEEKQVRLRPGDLLLLYTDGVTEAQNRDGICFGEENLCSLLLDRHALVPRKIIDDVLDQVRLFTGMKNFRDDVSLVALKAPTREGDPTRQDK
jgi:Na+/proline symporter/serine phosphatase RsbU (regulator of sigma subunit)